MTVLALAAGAQSASADHSVLELVTPGGADIDVSYGGQSEDGRRVVFVTEEALDAADQDAEDDVYAVAGGPPILLSGGEQDLPAAPRWVSPDGTRVIFDTEEQLSGDDTDFLRDVYASAGGVITLLSIGDEAWGAGFARASRDGSRVFFVTGEALTDDDADEFSDVYERHGAETTLVSTGPGGGSGPFAAQFEGLSDDGTRVYFSTEEPLVPGDVDDGTRDLHLRVGGTTTRIATAGGGPFSQSFGADAGEAAFFETSEALVAEDDDAVRDVYRYENGVTTLVSTGTAEQVAVFEGVSEDGYAGVLHHRGAARRRRRGRLRRHLRAGRRDDDADLHRSDRRGRALRGRVDDDPRRVARIPRDERGARRGGRRRRCPGHLRARRRGDHVDHDRADRRERARGRREFAVTADGSRAVLTTTEALVPEDLDDVADVYERAGGVTTLISRGDDSAEGSEWVGTSSDGSRIHFLTGARLAAGDVDDAVDLYVSAWPRRRTSRRR